MPEGECHLPRAAFWGPEQGGEDGKGGLVVQKEGIPQPKQKLSFLSYGQYCINMDFSSQPNLKGEKNNIFDLDKGSYSTLSSSPRRELELEGESVYSSLWRKIIKIIKLLLSQFCITSCPQFIIHSSKIQTTSGNYGFFFSYFVSKTQPTDMNSL